MPFRGRPRLIADGRADHPIEQGEIGAALKASMPGVDQADVAWLTDYDDYYYDRDRAAPLPVVRARFPRRLGNVVVRRPEPWHYPAQRGEVEPGEPLAVSRSLQPRFPISLPAASALGILS